MRIITNYLKDHKLFTFVMIIFVVQAGWIAVSTKFPMAYDEGYHRDAIVAYSDNLSPFVSSQLPSENNLGDITRYGSYFYHYSMSFPYRIAKIIGSDIFAIQVLRWISIFIFAAALIYIKKLLRFMGFSEKISDVSLLVTVLLPTTTFLAATINYDGMFFLFIAVHLLATAKLVRGKYADARAWGIFVASGALGSLTKYSFLPLLLATTLCVITGAIYNHSTVGKNVLKSYLGYNIWFKILLLFLVLVPSALFAERYIVNIVRYKNIQPDCQIVQTVNSCMAWGPWGRNHNLDQQYPNQPFTSEAAAQYTIKYWYPGMLNSLTLVGGPEAKGVVNSLYTSSSLTLIMLNGLFMMGLWTVLLTIRLQLRSKLLMPVLIVAFLYSLSLLLVNFTEFLRLGEPVAVQGRYILWFVPILMAIATQGTSTILTKLYKNKDAQKLKGAIILILVVFSTQFAGIITYVVRAEPSWFWSDSSPSAQINSKAKAIVNKIVVGL